MNILLTGQPKSGKTTLLKKLVEDLNLKKGLFAEEIRRQGERIGFEVVCSNGKKALLASIDSESEIRVGKYGVEIESFEELLNDLPELDEDETFYLDEIGQMQLNSNKFKQVVREYLDKTNTLVGTVSAVYENEFIDEVRSRSDVFVVEITPETREEKLNFIKELLGKIQKSRKYISEPERFSVDKDTVRLNSEHGQRVLRLRDGEWECNCDFYSKHSVCSHKMATDKLFAR